MRINARFGRLVGPSDQNRVFQPVPADETLGLQTLPPARPIERSVRGSPRGVAAIPKTDGY